MRRLVCLRLPKHGIDIVRKESDREGEHVMSRADRRRGRVSAAARGGGSTATSLKGVHPHRRLPLRDGGWSSSGSGLRELAVSSMLLCRWHPAASSRSRGATERSSKTAAAPGLMFGWESLACSLRCRAGRLEDWVAMTLALVKDELYTYEGLLLEALAGLPPLSRYRRKRGLDGGV
jgi:hypothetical protein